MRKKNCHGANNRQDLKFNPILSTPISKTNQPPKKVHHVHPMREKQQREEQREREQREEQWELEKRERQQQREREHELREKQRELEKREKQQQREREHELREKQQQREREQRELEKQQQHEREREKQQQRERELEKQRELERELREKQWEREQREEQWERELRELREKQQAQAQPCCGFFIVGLGCSLLETPELAHVEMEMSKKVGMPVKLMCNMSLSKTLFHIANSVCNMPPSKNEFVIKCIKAVQDKLDHGYNVFIAGHSYGGAVAHRIAQHFSGHIHNNLHIATFGSIYISKPSKVITDIHNYMHIHDVALKCTNCRMSDEDSCKLTWLKDQGIERKKPKKSILGTQQEWDNHNNYENMIMSVFQNQSIHLENKDMGPLTRV